MAKKKDSQDRIIEAATQLMWRYGYDAVSVDAICNASEFQKGSFYYAFPSKEHMLIAMIEKVWETDKALIAEIYRSDKGSVEKFRDHLNWFGLYQKRLFEKYGYVHGIFNMAIGINAPPSALEVIGKARDEHKLILTESLTAVLHELAMDTRDVDWWLGIISQLIVGVTIDARLGNTLEPFDGLTDSVFRLLEHGRRSALYAGE